MEKRRDRIQEMIRLEGLSQAEFARQADLNPSTLSHALTGRNNPTEEVLRKILAGFPKYSATWLFEGKGGMYNDVSSTSDRSTQMPYRQPLLEADEPIVPSATNHIAPPILAHNTTPEVSSTLLIPHQQAEISRKKVTKIILYYDDNTFQTFTPEEDK